MFTCSTLHGEHVNPALLTTARRRQYYDLNLDEIFRFYGALLLYLHTRDRISIVIAYTKDTRNPDAIMLFIVLSRLLPYDPISNYSFSQRYKAGKIEKIEFLFFLNKNTVFRMPTRLPELN